MIITLIYRYNQPKKFTGLPVHKEILRMKVQCSLLEGQTDCTQILNKQCIKITK